MVWPSSCEPVVDLSLGEVGGLTKEFHQLGPNIFTKIVSFEG